MKRFISILTAFALLISLAVVAALPASAAIEGDWIAVGRANQYDGSIPESEYTSVAGYEYDGEGFHLTAANWAGQTPWARFVSRNTVDLKDGVYMEIRIDEFNYSPTLDSWFTFYFWDQMHMTPGTRGNGEGVYNHIRPTGQNINYWYTGDCSQLNQTNRITQMTCGDDESTLFILELSWNEKNSTFVYTINGVEAPAAVISYMNEKWGGDNSLAYVGFALQHSELNGKVACTLLKFGTSADDCSVPTGEDSAEPEDWSYNYVTAPIVENPDIEPGQPAVLMNGDIDGSHTKFAPTTATGESISINADGTVHIVATNADSSTGIWMVDNDTSYSIKDFPVVMMVTKNLCTCADSDKIDGRCVAFETGAVFVMTGDNVSPGSACYISDSGVSWDAYYIGEDSYLSFIVDASWYDFEGRINGARFDVQGVDINTPGAGAFDVCFIAFFASEEDAEAYFMSYIEGLGYISEETTEEETTVSEEDTSSSEQQTEVGGDDQTTADDLVPEPAVKNGCGSVVGFGAIAIAAIVSAVGAVSFKKKEDR